jgi:hypothetical protein
VNNSLLLLLPQSGLVQSPFCDTARGRITSEFGTKLTWHLSECMSAAERATDIEHSLSHWDLER